MKIGFGGLLFLIFMTLKLTDFIDWSWWWIFAPLWMPLALLTIFAVLVAFLKVLTGKTR